MSGPIDLLSLKRRLGITDGADDTGVAFVVAAVNDWVIGRVGMDLSPAGTATRVFDGDGSREQFLPAGVRAMPGTVEVSWDGSTWTDVTADLTLLPRDWEKPPAQPYTTLRFKAGAGTFPAGTDSVRVTAGSWGYAQWPGDIVDVALTLGVRMWNARQTGQRDVIGSDALGNPMVSRFVSLKDYETCDRYRWANSDFGYV